MVSFSISRYRDPSVIEAEHTKTSVEVATSSAKDGTILYLKDDLGNEHSFTGQEIVKLVKAPDLLTTYCVSAADLEKALREAAPGATIRLYGDRPHAEDDVYDSQQGAQRTAVFVSSDKSILEIAGPGISAQSPGFWRAFADTFSEVWGFLTRHNPQTRTYNGTGSGEEWQVPAKVIALEGGKRLFEEVTGDQKEQVIGKLTEAVRRGNHDKVDPEASGNIARALYGHLKAFYANPPFNTAAQWSLVEQLYRGQRVEQYDPVEGDNWLTRQVAMCSTQPISEDERREQFLGQIDVEVTNLKAALPVANGPSLDRQSFATLESRQYYSGYLNVILASRLRGYAELPIETRSAIVTAFEVRTLREALFDLVEDSNFAQLTRDRQLKEIGDLRTQLQ